MNDTRDVNRRPASEQDAAAVGSIAGPEQAPELDTATQEGLNELIDKLAPLLQGRRLHNVVDLLSWTSDMVDMADEEMVNKLAANYENLISGLWAVSNAARYAGNEVTQSEVPSRLGLLRAANDEDVRRGLHFLLRFAAVFGRQMRPH